MTQDRTATEQNNTQINYTIQNRRTDSFSKQKLGINDILKPVIDLGRHERRCACM